MRRKHPELSDEELARQAAVEVASEAAPGTAAAKVSTVDGLAAVIAAEFTPQELQAPDILDRIAARLRERYGEDAMVPRAHGHEDKR